MESNPHILYKHPMRFLLILALCVFFASPAKAQLTVTFNQPLEFGTAITHRPNNVGTITVGADGTFSNNANILVISLGQRARFDITGAPASTSYTITIDSFTDVNRIGGGTTGNFTVDNFTTFPTVLESNGSGEDTFYLGARLSTNGGGQNYLDGTYEGTYDLTIDF